jgi:hypothetical protein
MTYYVTQFGDSFFELQKVEGYIAPTRLLNLSSKITAEEYKKLFYSNPNRETRPSIDKKVKRVLINGNACDILGKPLFTVWPKLNN